MRIGVNRVARLLLVLDHIVVVRRIFASGGSSVPVRGRRFLGDVGKGSSFLARARSAIRPYDRRDGGQPGGNHICAERQRAIRARRRGLRKRFGASQICTNAIRREIAGTGAL